ncbi:MAG: serine protease [Phycisphaerales bacterium]|nr:serine protease [Phycisphaerales bacterium]
MRTRAGCPCHGVLAFAMALAMVAPWAAIARADGVDRAIDALMTRVVRLHGVKAGLAAGYGSGVLISGDGLVVTVQSLLLNTERLRAVAADGTEYGAELIHADKETQLALLRLTPATQYGRGGQRETPTIGPDTFDFFEPGDSTSLRPGDWVAAGGNPFKVSSGSEPISITVGVFSTRAPLDARRKTREFSFHGEVLVIDAITANPGAPGGALVDLDGNWVGLVGREVTSNLTHTHFNYAIPVETVMNWVGGVLNPESRPAETDDAEREPYHGIKLFELGYQKKLVYVERVRRDSPAERAGLRKDDLIVSIDSHSIKDVGTFHDVMRLRSSGDTVTVMVIRNERIESLSMTLEAPQ